MVESDLVKALSEEVKIDYKQIEELIQALPDAIGNILLEQQKINIPGLGTFYTQERKDEIKAYFRASKKLNNYFK
ncbi:MAG: HU family DNA-binding protein [Nanoarchaeota archaeon]|nr:HU family DNA-binding protein [Nanoarchaeota archaeon]MBU1031065.1 HU family DNA-binding protein [Nanoarchaeota archaeon]MBU1849794.1 HU family DNA-binding protein [Nanoarchaeota archaeon]